jgi:subtilase family serine protease
MNAQPQAPIPNQNGWAWWCGTSFATPIISAITAVVLGGTTAASGTQNRAPQPGAAQAAVSQVYGARAGKTAENEGIMHVEQG